MEPRVCNGIQPEPVRLATEGLRRRARAMQAWEDDAAAADAVASAVAAVAATDADTEPVAEELLGAAPPDATVVDQVLHRELLAEAQRLQEDLNNRKIERKNKQEKFDQLQMSLQMISAEKAPSTATEVSANALEY